MSAGAIPADASARASEMERPSLDVSKLPKGAFGNRGIVWWGTVGFMISETMTLAVAAASYLYLRGNEESWPPPPTPLPALLIPTINMVVLLLALYPMVRAKRCAMQFDKRGTGMWMMVEGVFGLAATILRGAEFFAVNTKWDEDAYGSLVFFILGLHATLIIADLVEGVTIGSIFFTDRCEAKHYSDVEDAALYKWFLVLIWIPLYFLIYISPRLM
jgi:heme/copper-type cytochrome/quinol oxidase subunit 3